MTTATFTTISTTTTRTTETTTTTTTVPITTTTSTSTTTTTTTSTATTTPFEATTVEDYDGGWGDLFEATTTAATIIPSGINYIFLRRYRNQLIVRCV